MRRGRRPGSMPWWCRGRRGCRWAIATFSTIRSAPRRAAEPTPMARGAGAGEPRRLVEVPGGQGVQAGDYNTQDNTYIGTYIESQVVQAPAVTARGPVVVGDVP